VKRTRTVTNLIIVAGFTAICIIGMEFLAINIGQPVPFTGGYTVHAVFPDADGVPSAADVRVSGVDVGKVVEVVHDPAYPGETVVTLQINDSHSVPVYTNGYAKVRPKTLLGEKYVDLTVGSNAAAEAIASGGYMPIGQAGKDVSNDEIFNAFDQTTRQQQSKVLQALDAATLQRSGDIQAILPQLSTVVSDLRPLANVYEKDQPQVDNIFVQLNTIMATLADEHTQLGGVLSNGTIALGAIAQKDQALLTTLQQASIFSTELNNAMAPTIVKQQQAIQELYPALSPNCTGSGAGLRCGQNALLNQVVAPQTVCGNRPCGIDEVFTGTLLGNVNYPNDQLTVSSTQPACAAPKGSNQPGHCGSGELVTLIWDSMFSQPAGDNRALNLVLSFHCDAVTTTLSNMGFPGVQQLIDQLNGPPFNAGINCV
jgi:virulence factor Mce-like protein